MSKTKITNNTKTRRMLKKEYKIFLDQADGCSDGFHSPVSSPESFYSSSFASTPSPSHGFDNFLPKMKNSLEKERSYVDCESSGKYFSNMEMNRFQDPGADIIDLKVSIQN